MARVKPSSKTDRRLLRNRIMQILSRLEKVEKQREQGRRSRAKADIPTVSLVGYTNAGKSTLFNQITAAEVYAANQLFATLDPTLRRIDVPDVGETVLADTVGFIRHLPHDLVAAFKATLQETRQATLLLHVIDAADVRVQENIDAVNTVLAEIEADEIPALLVMNKIDMLDDFEPRIDRDDENKPIRVWLSAQTGVGVPLLFSGINGASFR
ncbi:GTP-binding protein HflX [Klebsiella pneumoniae]|uniref:GTP-binding protein HflX n=1 Tax=Klebsiella pneumoniae TaxID=573 RepID=A0A378FU42_KLEPN|nr:GTP-binding protein HflX [Klebsiella pneumoniae]